MTLFSKIKYFKNGLVENMKTSEEILWAEIFKSTIHKSKWFNDAISPGRWAVGYPFLYVLYRILDEVNPNKVLELGLGQSSKLTCSYTNYNKDRDILHCIIDHDEEWRNFFINGNEELFKDNNSETIIIPIETVNYENTEVIRYKNFKENIPDVKWNLILVDAPFGSDVFSRIDVLDLIPQNLADTFVILIDDCEREGELNTCKKIEEKLSKNKIAWRAGTYSGMKDMKVIVSENLKFLCTL